MGFYDHTGIKNDLIWSIPNFQLENKHLENCKVLKDRNSVLDNLPKHSICVELGVEDGNFSEEIINRVDPVELVLVDNSEEDLLKVSKRFETNKNVITKLGDSVKIMETYNDNYFDWVYIDTDHSYELTKKELEVCSRKVKDDGHIALHDYIHFDYFGYLTREEERFFGVIKAVNDFVLDNKDYEISHLTLESGMYNTIVIRKINGTNR